jgi:hypothetical protein
MLSYAFYFKRIEIHFKIISKTYLLYIFIFISLAKQVFFIHPCTHTYIYIINEKKLKIFVNTIIKAN